MIVEDVLRLPREPGVIVEGFDCCHTIVKPLLPVRDHAVWLLPTPGFREACGAMGIPRQNKRPARARRNLLERDAMFTQHVRKEAQHLELNTIGVDSTMTVDELLHKSPYVLGL
jgi:hypothetical protein